MRFLDVTRVEMWFMEHPESPGGQTQVPDSSAMKKAMKILITFFFNPLIQNVSSTYVYIYICMCMCVSLKAFSKVIQVHPGLLQDGFDRR